MVKQVNPLRIYLFGSFADGTYTEDSDFDFYVVVKAGSDLWDVTAKARKAVKDIKIRPVDIVAGTSSRFNEYGRLSDSLYVESEVFRKGILLYNGCMKKILLFQTKKSRELLVRRHGVTPTYAQNLLDDKPSTSTVVTL